MRAEYATDERLSARQAAHVGGAGPDAREELYAAVAETEPRRVLEVGCGQGWLAERIQRELGAEVVALDQSEHMVELTQARGVDAVVANVESLPFEDRSFDCTVAAWMLYHVADVDRALAELARVLQPGGRLVAVTNAREHVRELYELTGLERPTLTFETENAAEQLSRHFARVERRDAFGWSEFATRADAQAYVEASPGTFAGRQLPDFTRVLRVRRAPTIFVATT